MNAKTASLVLVALAIMTVTPVVQAVNTKAQEQALTTKYTKAMELAKKAFSKKPKDAKIKATYIGTILKLANHYLEAEFMPPKSKYPASLKLYREILKLNPKHAIAKERKDTIEGIYRSMNRPIPK